jgi:hypothetical protein
LSDDEILSRLLALNLARAAEEAKATGTKKPRAVREKTADERLVLPDSGKRAGGQRGAREGPCEHMNRTTCIAFRCKQ